MIAYCQQCNTAFQYNLFSTKGAKGLTLIDVGVTCPKCGKMAFLLNGTYDFDADGLFTLISGPKFTVDILENVRSTLRKAEIEKWKSDKVIKEIAIQSPEISGFFEKGISKGVMDLLTLIGVFVGILSLVITAIQASTTAPASIVVNDYTINLSTLEKDKKNINQPKTKPHAWKRKKRKR